MKQTENARTNVTFHHAFSVPHRLCVALPDASRKTLLDAETDQVVMSWADGDTRKNPLGAYLMLHTDWTVRFTAEANGKPMRGVHWQRTDQWIPSFYYRWELEGAAVTMEVTATCKGDVIRLSAYNGTGTPVSAGVYAFVAANVVNMKWADFDYDYSICTPIWGDRGDRMVLMIPQKTETVPRGRENVDVVWRLQPGETKISYMIRPYYALLEETEAYAAEDWEAQRQAGLAVWRGLIGRAPRIELPDKMVTCAYQACLADIFVMREEQADGRIAGLAGTEMYRAANTGEPCFQAYALLRSGFYEAARENIEFVAQFQEPDGNWEDARQWGRMMWSASGWKSSAIREYYLFTKDRAFLEEQFPRMLASARWSQKQREATKKKHMPADRSKNDPPEWGLMPRGMGDCGLNDHGDLFGVFYPHNFLHCMGLECAAWAAEELGYEEEAEELRGYYEDMHRCLLESLKKGCITESDGTQWIPGAPNAATGSRWGAADAIYPAGIIPEHCALADGTMKKLQGTLSEGGLPVNLGWLQDGLWVAIALDAIAYANVVRGDEDIAADYLYAVLNHGTPLFTWCEERGPEPGATVTGGDRQHAWTPICVARFCRDMLVMDGWKEEAVYLNRIVPRDWYADGCTLSASDVPTHHGVISYSVRREGRRLRCDADLSRMDGRCPVRLYVRLPQRTDTLIFDVQNGSQVFTLPDA